MAFTAVIPSQTIACTTTSSSRALHQYAFVCRLYNSGPNDVRVSFTTATGTATATDMLLPAGLVETHHVQPGGFINAVCTTGTATLEVSSGYGD